jgi:hypothetical protein
MLQHSRLACREAVTLALGGRPPGPLVAQDIQAHKEPDGHQHTQGYEAINPAAQLPTLPAMMDTPAEPEGQGRHQHQAVGTAQR